MGQGEFAPGRNAWAFRAGARAMEKWAEGMHAASPLQLHQKDSSASAVTARQMGYKRAQWGLYTVCWGPESHWALKLILKDKI